MTPDGRIILASNRGPVSFVSSDNGFETKRGAGGLAGALDPVARRLGERAVWIAAATSATDRKALGLGATERLRDDLGYRVDLLDIDPDTYATYYDDVSNRLLWFANHCLWDEVGIDPSSADIAGWKNAYVPVNQRFARSAAERSEGGALVLFQDYHLSLAPALLRDARADDTILHFTHSSFCAFDQGIGLLPDPLPHDIVRGMLGADLVGFHEPRWAKNFLDCCERTGYEVDRTSGAVAVGERRAWVRCYPIPIDASDLVERSRAEETQSWARRHQEWAAGRSVIARADRMEPSKNIVRGFEAFGRMLDADPSFAGRVCFVACVYPSRQEVPEYQRYAERIESTVEAINQRHPDSIALFTEDDFDRSLGALLIYDVLLVNSIMDGMNLVSKEGPALNQRDGALVLSEGAGSFGEMKSGAVVIDDPFDVDETSARIRDALALGPKDRKENARLLRDAATARVPEEWVNAQIEDLEAIRDEGAPVTSWEQLA